MIGGSEPSEGGGLRRPRSGEREEHVDGIEDQSNGAAHAGSCNVNGDDAPVTQNSATDVSSRNRPGTTESIERVRFSTDTGRWGSTAKKRKSDEITRDADGADDRPGAPALSVDPRAATAMKPVNGSPIAQLPIKVSGSRSNINPQPSRSPKARIRGMSLRSSLFARNIDRRSRTGDSIIEMDAVGSSSADSDRPRTAKSKASQVSVSVAPAPPVVVPSPPLAGASSRKSSQGVGISALPNYQHWVQKQANRHLPLRRIKENYRRARKFVLRIHEIPPSKDGRHIPLDPSRKNSLIDERTRRPFINNFIKSSKYSAWNFLPRQLFAQFSKLANFYFLTISILQMIPGLSTTGTYTTIIPLLFFVSISMTKEGYEDLRRHRLDKDENNREAKVLRAHRPVPIADGEDDKDVEEPSRGPIHWASVKWQSLQVGDIVKLERDEAVPADIMLLGSKGGNNLAYIETMALDGETNLKNKQPSAPLVGACTTPEDIVALENTEIVVEDPNLDLYNLDGRISVNGGDSAPLTNNEIIYRGSVLRNTPEIYGTIIYSGEECKIRMNANKNPHIKAPSLQAIVNKIVIMMVTFVISLALFNTIAYQIWSAETEEKAWYLTHASVAFGPIVVSFIIMFNTMIPLSLYVSLEIIKVAQMFLLNDIDMYDEASNTPFEARTSTINEELGQISYVFSDKTGTLTENVMRFRKLSVAGTAWLHDADLRNLPHEEDMLLHRKRKVRDKGKGPLRRISRESTSHSLSAPSRTHSNTGVEMDNLPRKSTATWRSTAAPGFGQPEFSTTDMIRYIQRRPHTAFARRASMMVLSMALCHTCLPERGDDNDISYQAASPDELALVEAARELGYVAWDREISTLALKLCPNGLDAEPVFEKYEILDVIEFSSKRKRMSVLVRFPDGRICVICKGADSVIMQRLRLAALASQKVAEIEKRVNERRSMEAQQALQRRGSMVERQCSFGSYARASMTLGRPSLGRPSIGKLGPIQDDVDGWLKDCASDVASPADERYYNPRLSAQLRRSLWSEHRTSLQSDTAEDPLVDEALVTDDAAVIERCFQHVNEFATEGLRTLLYGHRFLDEDEYRAWKKIYQEAVTSLVDRQKRIEDAGEFVEQDLELGGATAIEDKLQKGVPETIDRLRLANIKLWMLTGDKRETAINIGHSCRLIKDYSSVTVLDHEAGNVEQNIAAAIVDINRGTVAHAVIVIDGQTLGMINAEESMKTLFLDLAILADSVVCCRASPSQKAALVHAIRRRVGRSVTLAVGDGANDIAMIQEAHVGIGITGKEGLQAARSSDYSIAQFRFLTKLLLVHGRWNYVRTCKYTVGTFWKEMLFYLTQALYQRWNGYTGTSLYEQWSLSMFNTLFTSLPVIFLGIFEKDLAASTLIAVPELYTKGQRSAGFNFKVYLTWVFMAASEAMIVFFTMKGLFAQAQLNFDQGLDNGLFAMGDMTFTACIVLINSKLQLLEQRNKSIMALVCIVIEIGGWFLWNIILSAIYKNNNEYNVKGGILSRFGRNSLWWLCLILIVASCILFEIIVRSLKNAFFPTDVETFQELEKDGDVRRRFEEASAPWLQAGWKHGTKESTAEVRREAEVQDLLDRPRVMEEGRGGDMKTGVETEERAVVVDDELERRSTDVQDMLSRRFGSVRRESLATA